MSNHGRTSTHDAMGRRIPYRSTDLFRMNARAHNIRESVLTHTGLAAVITHLEKHSQPIYIMTYCFSLYSMFYLNRAIDSQRELIPH